MRIYRLDGAGSNPVNGSDTLLSRSSDHLTHGLTSRLWLRVEWQGILTCPHNLRTHRRPHNPYTGFHKPPAGCASTEPAWKRAGFSFVICRLSAVWSAARVCRHGWFDSKGGFLYSRSSSDGTAVSKTVDVSSTLTAPATSDRILRNPVFFYISPDSGCADGKA